MADLREQAAAFLGGTHLRFEKADELWRGLQKTDETSLARQVLSRLRAGENLLDELPTARAIRQKLCQQEALITSKDPELSSSVRHDRALEVLADEFDLDDASLDGDAETLGIAGGIHKRRWSDLGQHRDLQRSAELYTRGALGDLGDDAYAHINAAFLDDLLAYVGDDPETRTKRAKELRERIVTELAPSGTWWNAASRAEAFFGLGHYEKAIEALGGAEKPEALWELETTATQLATLAYIREEHPLEVPEIRAFFEALLPGAADAVRSAFVGRVGLALSGGGFRSSFYHLGVLARLAELNVLRHVAVLSCVSGGSILGACYWLALRKRFVERDQLGHQDYIDIVSELIDHFEAAVAVDLRAQVQPSKAAMAFRILVRGEKGVMDPEETAAVLEEHFYRPLLPGKGTLFMHDLPFKPADHNAELTGSDDFNPRKHNWLRANKVPVLVLNSTTVNTGHAWQFTPKWMGESPWAVHPAADAIPRLEWSEYKPQVGWQMPMAQAVAASASVPGLFAPLKLEKAYDGVTVQLVDGGVHDNQGTVSLLAQDCNVVLISDAAGQLMFEDGPAPGLKGLSAYAGRSMSTLMERIRQANYADLAARCRSGLLRGMMFLHMKAGLDADTIRLRFSQESFEIRRFKLSPSGVRKDFQQALAELRTDLDAFTQDESRALMACGYQMASKAFERDLAEMKELWDEPIDADWPFAELLDEITSTAATTDRRDELLEALRKGSELEL